MSNEYPTPWPKDPPPVSSDIVIITRKELENYGIQCFRRGVERGKFEESVARSNSTARGSEGHLEATESTGAASPDAAVRLTNSCPCGAGEEACPGLDGKPACAH